VARIEFLGPIGRKPMDIEIDNLKELKNFFSKDDDIEEWLKICAVAVNDTIINTLDTKIKPNDKISLLPPVCGG